MMRRVEKASTVTDPSIEIPRYLPDSVLFAVIVETNKDKIFCTDRRDFYYICMILCMYTARCDSGVIYTCLIYASCFPSWRAAPEQAVKVFVIAMSIS